MSGTGSKAKSKKKDRSLKTEDGDLPEKKSKSKSKSISKTNSQSKSGSKKDESKQESSGFDIKENRPIFSNKNSFSFSNTGKKDKKSRKKKKKQRSIFTTSDEDVSRVDEVKDLRDQFDGFSNLLMAQINTLTNKISAMDASNRNGAGNALGSGALGFTPMLQPNVETDENQSAKSQKINTTQLLGNSDTAPGKASLKELFEFRQALYAKYKTVDLEEKWEFPSDKDVKFSKEGAHEEKFLRQIYADLKIQLKIMQNGFNEYSAGTINLKNHLDHNLLLLSYIMHTVRERRVELWQSNQLDAKTMATFKGFQGTDMDEDKKSDLITAMQAAAQVKQMQLYDVQTKYYERQNSYRGRGRGDRGGGRGGPDRGGRGRDRGGGGYYNREAQAERPEAGG